MNILILVLIIFGLLIIYLIYKTGKYSEDLHSLRYDLNDLEVNVGVIKGEDWALNSKRYKEKRQKETQDYYNGKLNNGEWDMATGIDRRKKDAKNPKLHTPIE